MPQKKANEARFFFVCGDLDDSTFEIGEFSGIDQISSPYVFDIRLHSKKGDINPEDIIGKQATLYIHDQDRYLPYSGIVNKFRFVDQNPGFSSYIVSLVPELWILSLNIQTRIFQKMTIPEIVENVLTSGNLKAKYEMNIKNHYSQQEYIVQYRESDLDFISRLMESNGIWYCFKENPQPQEKISSVCTSEKMVVMDTPEFEDISGSSSLSYRSASGLNEESDDGNGDSIYEFQMSRQVTPSQVLVKNYNYRTPEIELKAEKTVRAGTFGTVYEYGGAFKDTVEADSAAVILANRIISQMENVEGSGNCRRFRAGYRFSLKNHSRKDLNSTYLLTKVCHKGSHNIQDSDNLTYETKFTAISNETAESFVPEKKTVEPKISGVITAFVEANGSDYASIDEKGRYKVRMPFDINGNGNFDGSKYIRLAQPYGGSQYGMHFPLHEGTEMILACIDGDPNKPLGLGTVPNAGTLSPVTSTNKHQNIIRTAAGNEILMDDAEDKQKIHLVTRGKNILELDDENKRLFIQSKDKNKLLIDDKNESVSLTSGKHVVSMSYKKDDEGIVICTAYGHVVRIDDKNKRVTIQSKGGQRVDLDDNGKKITLSDGMGKSTVTLDGNEGLALDTKGKLRINALQDVEINGANVKIKSNTGKIDLKATQDLSMSGLTVNGKATGGFKIEGLQVDVNGKTGVKVKGIKTEVAGDASIKVTGGGQAELSAGAMTTVKGGMVTIN